MSSELVRPEPPYNFLYCINAQCPQAARCLRYQQISRLTPRSHSLDVLNPMRITTENGECTHFLVDEQKRFALGITHLLDNVPHSEAVIIKNMLITYFNRATYYRCRRRERLITPAEQTYIRDLFVSRGITDEPLFDEYVLQYDWGK